MSGADKEPKKPKSRTASTASTASTSAKPKSRTNSTAKPAAKAPAKKAAAAAPAKSATKKDAAPKKEAAPKNAAAYVPEGVLKKRKTAEQNATKRAEVRVAKRKAKFALRKAIFKRAESYVKEYRAQAKEIVRFKRQAKANGNYFRPAEAKVSFVIRIRGINRLAPKTVKILQLLRLRQVNNGVFVRMNKATQNMLRLVEPYVTYGPPTVKTISDLIYKRGYGKVNKQRIALAQNSTIETVLGKYGIQCVEDLVHEIATCGIHFKQANNFLWPFKLSAPLGGLSMKRRHFVEGGQHGNREEEINKLVKRMI